MQHTKPYSFYVLIILQFLLGVGAVFGGVFLILDPSGEMLKMPIEMLETSPFNSFFIPGMILLLSLGVYPLIITVALITKWEFNFMKKLALFKDKHWAWNHSLYIGFATIIWITTQIYMIQDVHVIHIVYIGWGLLIQIFTLVPGVQAYFTVNRTTHDQYILSNQEEQALLKR
ncbi:hypothetical protein [Bacillus sp. HMF5848]|uniref:hypothetical protein n=1 Tax=Bacillus sp. HMF5848 TaxID=2495421 RepID=UPI00163A12DE|nr:hypothetical protein [Bacillus sp. HMF5848]